MLLITAILFEVALQVIAVGAHLLSGAPARVHAEAGAIKVLCVGDSYTYGDGASTPDHGYPARLQRLLASKPGPKVDVVNTGLRGQDSRAVLSTLPTQLTEHAPAVVCILCGANDEWNRPALLESTVAERPGFQWRWRTARLFKILVRGWGVLHEQPAEAARPVPQPTLAEPPSVAMLAVAERLVRDAGVALGSEQPTWPGSPDPRIRENIDSARSAMRSQQYAAAVLQLRAALATADADPLARGLLVEALTRQGQRDDAAKVLQSMRADHAAGQSLMVTEHFVNALWAAGESAELLEVAKRSVQTYPSAPGLWHTLAAALRGKDPAAAGHAYRRVLELAPALAVWHDSTVAGLGTCIDRQEPANAARLLCAGLLLNGDLARFPWACYQIAAGRIHADVMRAMLQLDGLDPRGAALLRRAYDEMYGDARGQWQQVMASHLRAMADVVRKSGAMVVFASYPFDAAEQNEVLQASALACDAPFVDVRARFDVELRTRKREDLFVADGHCNDDGYAIMAEEIERAVTKLLRN